MTPEAQKAKVLAEKYALEVSREHEERCRNNYGCCHRDSEIEDAVLAGYEACIDESGKAGVITHKVICDLEDQLTAKDSEIAEWKITFEREKELKIAAQAEIESLQSKLASLESKAQKFAADVSFIINNTDCNTHEALQENVCIKLESALAAYRSNTSEEYEWHPDDDMYAEDVTEGGGE